MSPPFLDSAPPLSSTLSSPSLISQPPFGNSFSRAPRQPQRGAAVEEQLEALRALELGERVGHEARVRPGQLPDADVAPLHREAGFLRLVDLEADEARARHAVDEVRDRDAVHPRAQPVAVRLHAVVVPLADA